MKSSSSKPTANTRYLEYCAVIFGGAIGSLSREIVTSYLPDFSLLTSTFIINIAACFVLGWLLAMRHRLHVHYMHLGAIGFCGGLSTFSTFAADIFNMFMGGDVFAGVLAPTLEIGFGVLTAWLGENLGRRIHGKPSL